MEKTFIMVKPDGVQRGLVGNVVHRFEQKGLKLVAGKFLIISKEKAEFHYEEHRGKDFYDDLIEFITSGPVFAMAWEADNAIQLARTVIGKTNILDAEPGTIRGDYAVHTNRNIIHGSDSPESANREISNFFRDDEVISYKRQIKTWL